MNERIKKCLTQAGIYDGREGLYWCSQEQLEKLAELIVKDVMNEVFVVYPGGKKGSDVKFQNISPRQWINQIFGVEE